MERVSEKLTQRVPSTRFGISHESIKRLALSEDLIADILEVLDSSETLDQQFALCFAEELLDLGRLSSTQEARFVSRLRQLFTEGDRVIRSRALNLLVRFNYRVANFRALILEALKSASSDVRAVALRGYEICCNPKEVEPLEEFEHDGFFGEIAMGGPLVFDLRDQALETIERVIGVGFTRTRKSEAVQNGQSASFYSWEPFHKWNAKRGQRWF